MLDIFLKSMQWIQMKQKEKLKEAPQNKSMKIPSRKSTPLFFNPEKSWLSFNERVFDSAIVHDYPLLERLKFLAIAANNLDEFFMVYFGRAYTHSFPENEDSSFHSEEKNGDIDLESDIDKHFNELKDLAHEQINLHVKLWITLRKELRESGIDITSPNNLSKEDLIWLEQHFQTSIFPILTPMAIDSSHPIPLIPSGGIAIAVVLKSLKTEQTVYAFIPLPPQLDRFIQLPGNAYRFIAMEHVIALYMSSLFSNYEVIAQGIFRVIRNSKMEVSKHYETDLKETDLRDDYEHALQQRLHGEIIHLEVNERMPEFLRLFVREQFDADPNNTVIIDGFIGIAHLMQFANLDMPKLLFPPFDQRIPQRLIAHHNDIFEAVALKDILLHHPYESFEIIVQLLRSAARDKDVVSIKIALYRTGSDSPIIEALKEAVRRGKSVTAIVEIKAHFDEERNIKWSRDLEKAGVHVIYGIKGLKTHGKICLIVRNEEKGMKSYAHFGTGNYNAKTANIYTDLSLITADPVLCQDAAKIFHYMTGYARIDNLEKVVVSPSGLRNKLLELIQIEIQNTQNGLPGNIWLKMNSLTDTKMIKALYEASQAGVKIELIVRGMCCLVPGVKGLSENIKVKSIIGRFLEHSRIFCFGNGNRLPSPQALAYISSADWMPRNLNTRFETMVPIENKTIFEQIVNNIMYIQFADRANSWSLKPSGKYILMKKNKDDFNAHDYFITHQSLSGTGIGPYPVFPKQIKPNI